jgi:cobalt/nickel transport protein
VAFLFGGHLKKPGGRIMKKSSMILIGMVFLLIAAEPARSHFGMLIPSDSMVMQEDSRRVTVTLSFSHPFEMQGMELAKPRSFAVVSDGKTHDLRDALEKTRVMGHTAWQASYAVKRPGVYVFYMEPEPYWEPAENLFIIHYTKTVISAFGDDEGWDAEIGLKTEIVPLSKPFGLYAGNVFQGIVKLNGKPVPFAEVEVEYYNIAKKYTAPSAYMITQTIKADPNGVFTYAAPFAGWWGFAALHKGDFQLNHEGEKKDVELGAVIWIKFHNWQK